MRIRTSPFLFLPVLATSACTQSSPSGKICGEPSYYQIDRIQVAGPVADVALDLDRDGYVDDDLGALVKFVKDNNPDLGDLDARASARLAAGEVTWLVAVTACDDGTQQIELTQSGGGDAVPISVLVDPLGTYAPTAWVRAEKVTTQLVITPDAIDGKIGFALPLPDAARPLIGPFAAYLTAELAAGTSPYAAQVDANHDGVVSEDELVASPLIQALVRPRFIVDASGVATAMSAGAAIHAHHVEVN